MQIGQRVIAIGNALGEFDNTVTTGVLSAKDRDITASSGNGSSSEELSGLLQTDAAINQGNSGGPLVNILGQVIGINTAAAQSAENLGFAIPSNMAKSAIASYQKSGKISRPMIGVRYISNSKEIAEQNSLPSSEGVIVYSGNQYLSAVISGSPADKIGLKQYDIIIQIDDKKINAENTLRKILLNYKVGDKIKIKYLRDGKEKIATLKLSEAN
jgi:serine protease Do